MLVVVSFGCLIYLYVLKNSAKCQLYLDTAVCRLSWVTNVNNSSLRAILLMDYVSS